MTANDVVVVAGPINKGPETVSRRASATAAATFVQSTKWFGGTNYRGRNDRPATVMARLIVFLTGEDREPR